MATNILILLTVAVSVWLFYWSAKVEKNAEENIGKFPFAPRFIERDVVNKLSKSTKPGHR